MEPEKNNKKQMLIIFILVILLIGIIVYIRFSQKADRELTEGEKLELIQQVNKRAESIPMPTLEEKEAINQNMSSVTTTDLTPEEKAAIVQEITGN